MDYLRNYEEITIIDFDEIVFFPFMRNFSMVHHYALKLPL